MTESVIAAMEAAVTADPDNPALREHLASLLAEANRMEEAWTHATAGLGQAPANTTLLRVAADAGDATGRSDEAAGYRTLLNALDPSGSAPSSPTDAPPPPPGAAAVPTSSADDPPWADDGDVPDSVDDLLDMWGDSEGAPEPTVGELTRERLYLRDVGGMEDVKSRLQVSFLAPMKNPEMRAAFGKSMRGGLLLWGPPGCGKTFIAKAVAGELDANFYHVGLSDVLDMWIGSSEKNITNIFEIARRNAPCVLFLDEVDAIGQKRTNLRGGGGMRNVVNQLLQEMDGATSDNEGVFILAATNHPWDIDSALLRPGRLDRTLLVLPPDQLARESILELHLRNRPVEKLDLVKVAKHTKGLTGADLSLLCEQATEYAMTDSIETGSVRPITMKDLGKAVKQVRPSHGPWVESAKNYAMFNNEDGRYDDLLNWIKQNKIK